MSSEVPSIAGGKGGSQLTHRPEVGSRTQSCPQAAVSLEPMAQVWATVRAQIPGAQVPQDNGPAASAPGGTMDSPSSGGRGSRLQPRFSGGDHTAKGVGRLGPLSSPEWREIHTAVHGAPNPRKGKRASQKP